jgi:geranylgeranylglycerol-phosphate geranylgeranyltransferase
MNLFDSIIDHIMIGGPNAVSGWGLLVLLVFSGGVYACNLKPGVDLGLFLAVLAAAALTGNGVYAINAVYDIEADKVNKPNRPLPSGRMTAQHALRYTYILMALGLMVAAAVTILLRNPLMIGLWSIFTLLGFAYSKPPFKLKSRHVFGNLCFGFFVTLAAFIGMILTPQGITIIDLISYSFITLYIAGVVTMKDFGDYEGDKEYGDITLPVKVGRKAAALISIGLIALPLVVWGVISPPTSLLDWIMANWGSLIIMGSFAVYMVLDYSGKNHFISSAYSRVMYFYVILYTAYGLLKGSILPVSPLTSLVLAWDPYIALAVYVVIASVVVIRSWKTGHDVLKPKRSL